MAEDMQFDHATPDDWHNVRTFAELAGNIHERALKEYPESEYAKRNRQAA
jgi:hypothetical protein